MGSTGRRFACSLRHAVAARPAITASVEQVVLAASVFWALTANRPFFAAALDGYAVGEPSAWGYGLALLAMLVAAHVFLLALVATRRTVKPLLSILVVTTALATFFMQRYGVYMDPTMLRNVLATDVGEGRELLSWALVPHLMLYAALPLALLSRVRLVRRPLRHAGTARAAVLVAAGLTAVAALLCVFQPFSSLVRNHKEVRYLITPANYLWSLASVAARDAGGAHVPRRAVGLDAAPGASWQAPARPRIVVLVVGETARAANWGLSGYARQTTPELARLPVLNFNDVTACGTSTETSLPCMFAAVGRRDYDEARIRHSDSLLHVAQRAGVDVLWIDNQSGCKGVCDGVPHESVAARHPAGPCDGERCLDEALLLGLDERLDRARGVQLLVLHMLGNHGPAYHRRFPSVFTRFRPACQEDDLRRCSREQIVNAYDDALLYTDHVLASLIRTLQRHASRVDAAMLYVSDHGESLGENNLFLHGLPYAIAPAVQTRVPMVLWLSPAFEARVMPDAACMQRRARRPVSHDHLFHTVLGLLDVRTSAYETGFDVLAACRDGGLSTASR